MRQIGPGNCPICRKALEPVIASTEGGDSPELRGMNRRFWIGLVSRVRARRLSRATMKQIRQNLFLSFAYNVAGIPWQPACFTRSLACCSRPSSQPRLWLCRQSASLPTPCGHAQWRLD